MWDVIKALIMMAAWLVGPTSAGSCRAAKLCCQGRDSGCVIQKASPNAIIEGPKDKPCYCDHACLKLGDCCDDFRQTCGVIDCSVTQWSTWSACDNQCGAGIQRRSRTIVGPEENGGKHCPQIKQSRICQGFEGCRRRSHAHRSKDAVLLMPAESFRPHSARKLIEGYSAEFTILRASKACKDHLILTEGSHVCVQCGHEAVTSQCEDQLNPGKFEIGRWRLLTSVQAHCHGKWLSTEKMANDSRSAACQNGTDFVIA
ncbi:somatomedin-B and thrombospondin type-1 domain-containing protein [Orussus abietinus]|uniref:somatomedin-B and thrombospondin type-1 domain-containing protein n=1 Tax=Orussus abietinus TaxID=222816 RepID=UPI000625D7AA|nr:somatomedin-B and thrombospondin type-1 domain-containing protein [Orussus abietinus]